MARASVVKKTFMQIQVCTSLDCPLSMSTGMLRLALYKMSSLDSAKMVWKVPNSNRKTRDLSENLAQISPRKIIRELKRTLKTCMISRSLLRTGENKIVRTQSFKTMPASWKIILRHLVRIVFKTSRCLMCKKVLHPCNQEEKTTLIWETKGLLRSCPQN